MSSRILLVASALFLAGIGLLLVFASDVVVARMVDLPSPRLVLLGQLLGAACCGTALLNWMSKGAAMGGIYGRPLAMGNLTHFTIGGLALLKLTLRNDLAWPLIALSAAYLLFALLFGRAAFGMPGKATS